MINLLREEPLIQPQPPKPIPILPRPISYTHHSPSSPKIEPVFEEFSMSSLKCRGYSHLDDSGTFLGDSELKDFFFNSD